MKRFSETWLRNFTWFVLLSLLVPALVGAVGYKLLRTYESSATLWVEPQVSQASGDPWRPKTAADIYASRLSQLLLTKSFREDVLIGVATKTGIAIDERTRREAWVAAIKKNAKVAVAGPYLVELKYRSDDPLIAREMVSGIVDAFQQETVALKSEAAKRIADLYEQQLQQARESVAAAQDAKADPVVIQSRLDLLRTIEDRRNEVYGQSVVGTLSVQATLFLVDGASTPDERSVDITQVLLGVLSAFVVTILVELGVVALLTRLDRSVHNAGEVGALAAVPAVDMARVDPVGLGRQRSSSS